MIYKLISTPKFCPYCGVVDIACKAFCKLAVEKAVTRGELQKQLYKSAWVYKELEIAHKE